MFLVGRGEKSANQISGFCKIEQKSILSNVF